MSDRSVVIVDNLPPEIENHFRQLPNSVVLSVNDLKRFQGKTNGFTASSNTLGVGLGPKAASAVESASVAWAARMKRFYGGALEPVFRGIARREGNLVLNWLSASGILESDPVYVSWGNKDVSSIVIRHFIREDRAIELENGFFRKKFLYVRNKALLESLGVKSIKIDDAQRRFFSRLKVSSPQFFEDGITYYQGFKRAQLRKQRHVSSSAVRASDPFALIALQLDFDAATIDRGNGWTAEKIIRHCSDLGLNAVVRFHPYERQKSKVHLSQLASKLNFRVSQNTLEDDLNACEFVVTINSSVIGDCLQRGIPFIALGDLPHGLIAYSSSSAIDLKRFQPVQLDILPLPVLASHIPIERTCEWKSGKLWS